MTSLRVLHGVIFLRKSERIFLLWKSFYDLVHLLELHRLLNWWRFQSICHYIDFWSGITLFVWFLITILFHTAHELPLFVHGPFWRGVSIFLSHTVLARTLPGQYFLTYHLWMVGLLVSKAIWQLILHFIQIIIGICQINWFTLWHQLLHWIFLIFIEIRNISMSWLWGF